MKVDKQSRASSLPSKQKKGRGNEGGFTLPKNIPLSGGTCLAGDQ